MKSVLKIAVISLFYCNFCFAQERSVQYSRDFEFKNGMYLSFMDFKKNQPVMAAKIISDYNRSDRDFFDKVLSKTTFTYIDSAGKEQMQKARDVWGYCQNGTVHVNYGADFARVTVIGSICHFVASVQRQIGVSDPFMYNDPFYNPQRYVYVTEQMVLDFETGKISEFNVPNMESLLSRDEALFNQFNALKKKEKRDGIFLYLRKYNEKHPIYFPE